MNQAFTPELKEITDGAYYRPAVSIILPFEPKMSLKAELSYSLKITTDKVERELKKLYPDEIVTLVIQKLNGIIHNLNFNTSKKSIVIYVSPVFEKVLYLDIPVEEKIIVDESFEIRDLVYSKKQFHQFLVLQISGNESKMYMGGSGALVKIVSDTSGSVYEVINDIPERVANFTDVSGRREIIMDKFLHHIDNSLSIVLNSYHLPLFVMGAERIIGHFKSITRHGNAIIDYIYGSYEDESPGQLSEILRPFTDQWEKVRQKNLLNQLEDAAGRKKLSIGMHGVWKDAMGRKGRLLVIEKDYKYAAKKDGAKNAPSPSENAYNKFSHIKDAVDDVIEKVLEGGGDVEFVEKNMLKAFHHIALVRYY